MAEYGCEDFIHCMHLETKKLKQSFELGSSAGTGGVNSKLQRGRWLPMFSEGM